MTKPKLLKMRDVVANPSGWDSLSNYFGELPEDTWLCVLTRNRDSDTLTESNWAVALERLGGESENVKIFRFGHWACGWWEGLAVRANTPEAIEGQKIADEIYNYPVLDEDHFSQLEQDEADKVWRNCYTPIERIKYIREHRNQFYFRDFGILRAVIRGEYFNGYASELL